MHYVRLVTDYGDRRSLPAARLFAEAGLDTRLLDQREARLPYRGFEQLLERAAAALDDPVLGLHVGASAQPGYYGPYGFTLTTCGTAREVLARSTRYSALVSDAYRVEFAEQGDELIRYWRSNLSGGARPRRLHEQLNSAAWLTMARWVSGQPELNPNWIAFCHVRPADVSEYEALFRCPLRFGAAVTTFSMDRRLLDRPLPQADPRVQRMMEAVCQRLEQQFGTAIEPAWLAACRKAVVAALGRSEPKLETIAAAAGLSAGALQQRLAERKTNFRELVDGIRRDLALSYLQDPSLSLIDIACLLGFSEQSAFQRAFKRWTGATPGERRASGVG